MFTHYYKPFINLVLNYSISGDAVNENLGLERRVFFDEPGYPVNLVFPVTSQKDSENCIQQTVYIFVSHLTHIVALDNNYYYYANRMTSVTS